MLQKVVAYITREAEHGVELLVFRPPLHIKIPIQVPQGTVENGESVLDALWRELEEETGRSDWSLVERIAKVPFHATWRNEWQERHVFHLTATADAPDAWTYIVTDGKSDKGLHFEFFWLTLAKAKQTLHWSQNQWLALLTFQAS
jgi:8-oxo-dGTP pyrophosphatase MutT (NUDIX family)